MINRKQFTKMAKQMVGSQKRIINPSLIHPSREWWLGLLLAVLLFSAIAVWSTQTYALYSNDAITDAMFDEVDSEVYRKSLVEQVLENFSTKAERHNSYLQLKEEVVTDITTSDMSGDISTSTDKRIVEESIIPVSLAEETAPQNAPVTSPEEEIDVRPGGGNFEAN